MSLASRLARIRSDLPLMVVDAVVVVASYLTAYFVLSFANGRLSGTTYDVHLPRLVAVALVTYLLAGTFVGMYHQMWRRAGIEEARRIVVAGLVGGAAVLIWAWLLWETVPRAVILGATVLTIVGTLATRFQARLFGIRRSARTARPAIVLGAGVAGDSVVRALMRHPDGALRPVAILDDDPAKWGRRIANVPVVGAVDDLARVAAHTKAEVAVFAVVDADRTVLEHCLALAEEAGIGLKVVPTLHEIMDGTALVADVHDVTMADLLNRPPVQTDLANVAALIRGRRVLVTGAGGSIGSEISRQLAALDPEALCLVDRDETLLHDVVGSLPDGCPVTPALVDLRDAEGVSTTFATQRPEIVFHAGALKHVPLLESHPLEAIHTNVVGTRNLLEAAQDCGVGRLVFVSTDKAVDPVSVMGATKRMGEQLVVSHQPDGARYCAVRFGNVLGSRGSVIPTFARQIASGGPVTITDPRMERFFMTIPEAVHLVLQAAALSSGGEVFMLDMGAPVRIIDVAKRMIRLSNRVVGHDVEIRITGVRPGEKLQEELRSGSEKEDPTEHPKIRRVTGPMPQADVVNTVVDHFESLIRDRASLRAATMLMEYVSTEDATSPVFPAAVDDRLRQRAAVTEAEMMK